MAVPLRPAGVPTAPSRPFGRIALGVLVVGASCQRSVQEPAATATPSADAAPLRAEGERANGSDTREEGIDSGAPPVSAPTPPDMLLVPAGSFTMGADSGGEDDEHPAHTVTLAAFFLDRTEVTNASWDECVAAKVCRPKSDVVRGQHPDFNGPAQPVTGVSWDDARRYCAWRGKRLPREAEFERAARDTDERRFPWGNEAPDHDKTVFASGRPDDVGTHAAGRGPYGHDDLAGNVWEWLEDEYDPYAYRRPTAGEGMPAACPEILRTLGDLRREHKQGFTGSNPIPVECEHSIRGGAYNYDAYGLRSTNRVHHPGRFQIPMLGLRCSKDAT